MLQLLMFKSQYYKTIKSKNIPRKHELLVPPLADFSVCFADLIFCPLTKSHNCMQHDNAKRPAADTFTK